MPDRFIDQPSNPNQPTPLVQHEFSETFLPGYEGDSLRQKNKIVDTDPKHLLVIRTAGSKMVAREGYQYTGAYPNPNRLQFYSTDPFKLVDTLLFNEYDDPRYVVQDPPNLSPNTPTSISTHRENSLIFIGFVRPIPTTDPETKQLKTQQFTQFIINQDLFSAKLTYRADGKVKGADIVFTLKSTLASPTRFVCDFKEKDFEQAKTGIPIQKIKNYSWAELTYDPEKKTFMIDNKQSDEYSFPSKFVIPETLDAEKLVTDLIPEEIRTNPLLSSGDKDTWRNLDMNKLKTLSSISFEPQ